MVTTKSAHPPSCKVITMDGPAASGKSSVSRRLAQLHGWKWVSTGAFYRGLARVARLENVALEDEPALAKLASQPFWSVLLDWDRTKVHYRNLDITDDIYSEQTGQDASIVSRWALVRKALLKAQRDCTRNTDYLIAEGRDCGTVVFPDAALKFYLTASANDRAERRAQETGTNVAEIKRAQSQRDERDSQRQVAPLQIPDDAQILDTTGLSFEQVMKVVEEIVVQRFGL